MNLENRKAESPGDAEAKAFFKYKPMLAFLLKGCVDEYRDKRVPEIIEYINAEQPEEFREQDSIVSLEGEQNLQGGKVVFDVHFLTSLPTEGRKALVDIEAQGEARNIRFLMNRSSFYSSVLVASEKGHAFKKTEYDKMLPTYTIWVCVTSKKELENSILERETVFRDRATGEIVDLNKRLGNETDILQLADSKEVFIFLGNREKVHDKEKVENELLTALDIVFRGGSYDEFTSVLNRNEVNVDNREFEGDVRTMISLVQVTRDIALRESQEESRAEGREEGRAEGREEGRAEGREEGRAEGREEGRAEGREETSRSKNIQFLKTLMEELGFSQEKAVKFLKLSKEEEENLLEDLQAEKGQEQLHGVAAYKEAHESTGKESQKQEQR